MHPATLTAECPTTQVDLVFADPEVQRNIADFLKANNNPRIIFFDQVRLSAAERIRHTD